MIFQEQDSDYAYEKPDDVAVFHDNDDVLDRYEIPLPKLEEFFSKHLEREVSYDEAITLIDGYGLPKSEQYFRYVEIPESLEKIYSTVARKKGILPKDIKHEMLYDEIRENRDEYKEAELFIQREIFRKLNGYWFFNNGKPTYVTGWHYYFLNYCKLSNSGENKDRPYYRDKQRRMAIFYKYAYSYDKERYNYWVSYMHEGKEGIKPFNEPRAAQAFVDDLRKNGGRAYLDKYYQEIPAKRRTVHGITQPKTRREGYTVFICCILYCIITERPQMNAWIQALTEDDSVDKVFRKIIVEMVYRMPFWFVPFHDNDKQVKPANEYNFTYPTRLQMLETSGEIPQSLGSTIKPFSSAFRKIDGTRAGVIYRDECGKMTDTGKFSDIEVWWSNVARRTLEFGQRLVGFAMLGSTVGEMSGGGGQAYKRLCDMSHFRSLTNNGTTVSGLWNLFFPAYDGMQGFIDKHGMSVIDDPPTPIVGQDGEIITKGAKTHLKNIRDGYLRDENITAYINEIREMPWTWSEAWTPSTGDSGMNIMEMREQYSKLVFEKYGKTYDTYRLEWVDDVKFGYVELIADKDGKWIFSTAFLERWQNQWMNKKTFDHYADVWKPALSVSNRLFMGVDPFRYNDKNTTGSSKKSKGAIAIYYPYDEVLDAGKKGMDQISEDFVAVYNARPKNKSLFSEEVVKAAILFGCHINYERNEIAVLEQIQEWKYDGYVMAGLGNKGEIKDVQGQEANTISKQRMFANMDEFFDRNANRVKLPQVLDAWMKIPDPASLTDHDLCAATGWALDAIRNPTPEEQTTEGYRTPLVLNQSFAS